MFLRLCAAFNIGILVAFRKRNDGRTIQQEDLNHGGENEFDEKTFAGRRWPGHGRVYLGDGYCRVGILDGCTQYQCRHSFGYGLDKGYDLCDHALLVHSLVARR